jgi:hopanoid biosynthesis associated protein HpnK
MERRLIINADDFGLCEGVNRGIEQAHRQGVLTSATIMANMPAADEAVKIAKKLPKLGVGVHLNLTEGPALSKNAAVKVLVNSAGEFVYSLAAISILSTAVHTVRRAIRTELSAQIRWVIDKGIQPTHLDSHKHIHCFPAIFTIVCELMRRFKIPAVRWAFEPKPVTKVPWPLTDSSERKKANIIRIMARINRMQEKSFFKNDCLFGIAHTGKIDTSYFKAVSIYNQSQVAEVVTHPGYAEGLEPDKTRLIHHRKAELDALCDERTKRYLKETGIKLVHYGQI